MAKDQGIDAVEIVAGGAEPGEDDARVVRKPGRRNGMRRTVASETVTVVGSTESPVAGGAETVAGVSTPKAAAISTQVEPVQSPDLSEGEFSCRYRR